MGFPKRSAVSSSICFVLMFLLTNAAVNPITRDCKGNLAENFLDRHHVYQYQYHGSAVSSAVGTTDIQNQMDIRCQVQISHSSHCLFQMEVKKCHLDAVQKRSEGDDNPWISNLDLEAIREHPVAFTLNEGEVIGVFSDPSDPLYSVNIKRGIISAFVITKTELKEGNRDKRQVDVHGTCPTVIIPTGEGQANAKKDMLHCAIPSRNDWQFSPYSMFWNMSFIQYVINSTSECDFTASKDLKKLNLVECHERHAIMLESTAKTTTAVQTNIHYKMELQDSSKKKGVAVNIGDLVSSSITLQYEKDAETGVEPQDFTSRAEEMLSEILTITFKEVRLDTIRQFTNLVGWLRSGHSLNALTTTVIECSRLNNGETCTKEQKARIVTLYQDALVQCHSSACMMSFATLVEEGLVPKSYLDLAFFSWTNIRDVKPKYIEAILRICTRSDTRFCWLTLGSFVSRLNQEQEFSEKDQLPEHVQKALSHLANDIVGNECSLSQAKFTMGLNMPQKQDEMLTAIKALGNMGDVAYIWDEKIVRSFLGCFRNNELLPPLRVAALESLRHIGVNEQVTKETLAALEDEKLSVELRLAAFKALMISYKDHDKLAVQLFQLLRNELTSSDVKSYVASVLKQYVDQRPDNSMESKNFALVQEIQSRAKQSNQEDFLLEWSEDYSHSAIRGGTVDLNFLPKELRAFGAILKSETVFNTLSVFPESLRSNLTMELFGKVFNLIQVGVETGGWENVILQVTKTLSTMKSPNAIQYFSLIMQQFTSNHRKPNGPAQEEGQQAVLLNQEWQDTIQSLHKIYEENHEQIKPYLLAYVNLLGVDLDFTSLEDFLIFVRRTFQRLSATFNPNSKKTTREYSTSATHSLMVIEAYHQFPTMMGIPLNWTTNATLAFSVKSGFNVEMRNQKPMRAAFHLHPSAALTFLNRMVFDLPTITQMGVQANSSAYTSTKWDWTVGMNPSTGNIEFEMKAPKNHRPLELFRTNQMITGDKYEDIEDWDIERVDLKECSSNVVEKMTGLKICREKSYADVTERVKPWFPMAGWAKWRFTVDTGKDLENYKIELNSQKRLSNGIKEYNVIFSASDASRQRRMPVSVFVDANSGLMKVEIVHSEFPDFKTTVSQSLLTDLKTEVAVKVDSVKEYFMAFEKKVTTEELKKQSESTLVTISHDDFKLNTPFNDYKWTLKRHEYDNNFKFEFLMDYQNKHSAWNWPKEIFPSIFWENGADKHFQLQIQGDYPGYIRQKGSKESHSRRTTTHLRVPYSVVEFVTLSTEKPGLKQFYLNMTKIETATGKLLTFANLSHMVQTKLESNSLGDYSSVRVYNITLPGRSWSARIEKDSQERMSHHRIELSGAKMVPKEENDEGYLIGWWNHWHSHRYDHKGWKVVYDQRLKNRAGRPDDLNQEMRSLISQESDSSDQFENYDENHAKKGGSGATRIDIALLYPFDEQEEKVEFNGSIKWDSSRRASYRSFSKDFVMQSTLHNLQLDSSSVYLHLSPTRSRLFHASHLTNTRTSENQGYYRLQYHRNTEDLDKPEFERCWNVDFQHNISAHWLQYSSNTTARCKENSEDPKARIVNLAISAVHPYWDEMDYEVKQYFDFSTPGGESMNFTSGFMDIAVVGDWRNDYFDKKINIISKTDVIPSSKWEIATAIRPGSLVTVNLEMPSEDINKVRWTRKFSPDMKKYTSAVSHWHKDSPSTEHRDAELKAFLRNPYQIDFELESKDEMDRVIKKWVADKANKIWEKIQGKLADPEHQVNQNLGEFLGGRTIWGYLEHLTHQAAQRSQATFNEVAVAVSTLDTFTKPSAKIVMNVGRQIQMLVYRADEYLAQTYIGWAFRYFEVPEALNRLSDFNWFTETLSLDEDYVYQVKAPGNVHVRYLISHPFYWEQFNQLPKFSSAKYISKAVDLFVEFEDGSLKPPMYTDNQKVGAIFGSQGVLTFDGTIYTAPTYPSSDCAFLLAHDTRASLFSALSTQKSLHLIFQDLAVTLSPEGRVYINGSKSESSLPIQSYSRSILVERVGSQFISVTSPFMDVYCHQSEFFCLFTMSALHHSGTMGLLGNANGERHDDMMAPDASTIESVSDFVSKYELSHKSICKNLEEPSEDEPSQESLNHCRKELEQNVLLKECLYRSQIESEGIVNACARASSEEKSHIQSFMKMFCGYHNLKVNAKPETCPTAKKWQAPTQKILQSLLVVDLNKKMFLGGTSQALKGLETLLNNMVEVFKADGYHKVEFSLVAFGGESFFQSHHVTYNNKLWFNEKEVGEVLRRLKFDGKQSGCIMKALHYGLDVTKFESSASKTVLVFTLNDEALVSDGAILPLLEDGGITLYTFSSFPSIEKGKKVFGLRADGLVFPQSTQAYMNYPRSPLAKLTSATRGAIFIRSFLEENKNAFFFYEAAEEVLAKVRKESKLCKVCSCRMDHYWNAITQCRPAHSEAECRGL